MHSTAILIFSNHPKLDARLKKLLPSASLSDNENLHRHLRKRVLSEANSTDVDVLLCPREMQRGANFASRIQNAFADAFKQGYAQVLLIGTDAAAMNASALNHLIEHLSTETAVLAPDRRGGAWAIGLHHAAFAHVKWDEIAWHTSAVFDELSTQLRNLGLNQICGPTLLDLNDQDDLEVFRREPADGRLRALLNLVECLLAANSATAVNTFILKGMAEGAHPIRRGPPNLAAA